jgi:hypothetical protein
MPWDFSKLSSFDRHTFLYIDGLISTQMTDAIEKAKKDAEKKKGKKRP